MKSISKVSILLLLLLLKCMSVMSQQTIERKDLLTAVLDTQVVSHVSVKQVTIPAGGKAAYHLHPCPVLGYIVSGKVLFQIEGQPQQVLEAGAAFFEPRNAPILHFDNASNTEPLVFIAYYMLEANEEFIHMLPQK